MLAPANVQIKLFMVARYQSEKQQSTTILAPAAVASACAMECSMLSLENHLFEMLIF